MKECTKCGKHGENQEFCKYKCIINKVIYTGYSNICKECENIRTRKYKRENRSKMRENLRNWVKRNKEKILAYAKKDRKLHKRECLSRAIFNREIIKNIVIRPEICSKCTEIGIIEAHHNDYSKPLDIIWLCRKCHGETRRMEVLL